MRRAMPAGVMTALLSGSTLLWPSANTEAEEHVTLPTLTATAQLGADLFAANCSGCHGENGGGTDQGPPLIHAIYNPGHHADYSFVLAARNGVRAHHWRFGNMPPQPQVTEAQVMAIVRYVREVQQANGITDRQHRM